MNATYQASFATRGARADPSFPQRQPRHGVKADGQEESR